MRQNTGISGRMSLPRGGTLYARLGKRLLDVALVVTLMAVALPLAVAVAVAVWASLGFPLFFCQWRPGQGGRPFTLVKFRTMTGARDVSGEVLTDERRLTRFGSWLRRASLDELPELINVLWGDMSLVGPRPLLMHYLPRYTAEQARRHDVRPGITGWAQVNGRNALTWEEKFKLDVWYVDHLCLCLDLRILWMTIVKVVSGEGISAAGHATMPEFMGNNERFGRLND